jgi:hypothetical protein
MSASDVKPVRRRSLYLPFLLVAMALAAWTVWWFILADQIEKQSDRVAAQMRTAGYKVSFAERSITGWPFRAFVQFRDVQIIAPSGHGFSAPRLAAEAEAYAIDKWVIAAPEGLVLSRGFKGKTRVEAFAIRGSVSAGGSVPNVAIELRKPVFTALPESEPFPLASAELIDFYVRPKAGAQGDGDFLFRIKEGRGSPEGVVSWIAGGGSLSAQVAGSVLQLDALRGAGWGQAVKNWSAKGGAITAVKGEAKAGEVVANAASGALKVGADGRLLGDVALELDGGPAALMAIARAPKVNPGAATAAAAGAAAQGDKARFMLSFTAEGTRLGPLRLAPAPKVF